MYRSILHSKFELLATDYVRLNKNWNYKDVTSTFYRLYYIDGGEGRLFNPTSSVKLESGGLYLIPSFTDCNYQCSEYLSQYYICFTEESADGSSLFLNNRKIFELPATDGDIAAVKRILSLNPGRDLKISYNPKIYEKATVLKDFGEQNKLTSLSAYVETCGLLLQLISRFLMFDEFYPANPAAVNSSVSDAIYYIQTNLNLPISVAALAKRANKNPNYFSRLFFENTGELPLNYIQKKRVARAQLLLTTTNLPFYEIALETGFESLSYFARIFKRITGQTPGDYKRNNRVL